MSRSARPPRRSAAARRWGRARVRTVSALAISAVLLALAVAVGVADGPGPASSPTSGSSGADLAREAADLARAAAQPWPSRQQASGKFTDYVIATRGAHPNQDQYGPEMLGYALLDRGLQDANRRLIDAGLRGIDDALRRPVEIQTAVFETLALASAYNLATVSLSADPAFQRLRARWRTWLTRVPLRAIDRTDRPYYNWNLVESVAIAELLDSHLQGNRPGAALADRVALARTARRVLGGRVPSVARASSTPSPAGRLTLLSDPPLDPLAYQAFSVGLLARSIDRLGPGAPAADRPILGDVARASWALMSPSGLLSYMGRSQDEAWVPAMTAYGAAAAASASGASPADRAADLAVVARALAHLRRDYLGGPGGLWITPGLRVSLAGGVRGLDGYATAAGYTGLTVMALNWTERMLRGVDASASQIGGERPGAYRIGRGAGSLVTVRTPNVWFAVRQTPAQHSRPGHAYIDYFGDLRYDAGLMAVDWRSGDTWHTVLPERPLTGGQPDSAGPRLLEGGSASVPYGEGLQVSASGVVTLRESFSVAGAVVGHRTDVRFEPVACGVRIVLPTRRGERWEYSAFFAGAPRTTGPRTLSDGRQSVSFSAPARLSRSRGYASGVEVNLTRMRLRFVAADGRPLRIEVCHA